MLEILELCDSRKTSLRYASRTQGGLLVTVASSKTEPPPKEKNPRFFLSPKIRQTLITRRRAHGDGGGQLTKKDVARLSPALGFCSVLFFRGGGGDPPDFRAGFSLFFESGSSLDRVDRLARQMGNHER